MRRRIAIFSAVVGLGLSLGWSTVAFAASYDPNAIGITASSACSVPGGSLTVGGTNFAPGESVTVTLSGTTLGTTTTGSANSFSTTVTIPSTATPGTSYTIVATGASGDSSSTTIAVATTFTSRPALAFTGGL